jgi:nitroreductase
MMQLKRKLKGLLSLTANVGFEVFRFIKYANLFSINSPAKILGKIIFYYHSIEKGLINEPLRPRFGIEKIEMLIFYIELWISRQYDENDSQFLSAAEVINQYYLIHKKMGIDISDIIKLTDLEVIKNYSDKKIGGTIDFTSTSYFENCESGFKDFSNSRHSLRHFTIKIISRKKIEEVIALARNAPSVCNRQGFRVTYISDYNLVQEALILQSGLNATAKNVGNIFIVSVDRSVFVGSSEWYQGFIDGGIFLQNLLYSCHYYRLGAVPLNWSKHYKDDLKMQKLLKLNPAEKIIALVAFGYPVENFKVPVSSRKEVYEILTIK